MRLVAHSAFHCSCGFAIDDPGEFGDHLRAVFDRPDDTGTDGRIHAELIHDTDADTRTRTEITDNASGTDCTGGTVRPDGTDDASGTGDTARPGGIGGVDGARDTDRRKPIACACGFQAADAAEYDDHALLVLIPPDNIGNDGNKHVPVDPSTPERWYFPETPGE